MASSSEASIQPRATGAWFETTTMTSPARRR